MKYKHIIWDWNGTLLDDRHFCIEIMNQVLEKRGMKLMTESWFLDNFCFIPSLDKSLLLEGASAPMPPI